MSTISVNTVKQFSGTSVTVASNLKVSGSTEMSGNVIVGNATSDTTLTMRLILDHPQKNGLIFTFKQ